MIRTLLQLKEKLLQLKQKKLNAKKGVESQPQNKKHFLTVTKYFR